MGTFCESHPEKNLYCLFGQNKLFGHLPTPTLSILAQSKKGQRSARKRDGGLVQPAVSDIWVSGSVHWPLLRKSGPRNCVFLRCRSASTGPKCKQEADTKRSRQPRFGPSDSSFFPQPFFGEECQWLGFGDFLRLESGIFSQFLPVSRV